MRSILTAAIAALSISACPAGAKPFSEVFPSEAKSYPPDAVAAMERIDFKQGSATVGSNLATLDLGDGFYFLDARDARYILEDIWGNPPSPETLGMVFPAGVTPYEAPWGLEIFFEDIGYVSDEDAGSYNYDELLDEMKQDARDANPQRTRQGYPTVELIGWAAAPRYDSAGRKLYWAKELEFGGDPEHTLNYNIRALGRRGVLNMNFIAAMSDLPAVESAVPSILNMVAFTEGNRYSDFNASTDAVAAVGLGGLIAGGVLAKKAGLIAVALLFLKKFWFLLLLPLIWLKNLFTGRRSS